MQKLIFFCVVLLLSSCRPTRIYRSSQFKKGFSPLSNSIRQEIKGYIVTSDPRAEFSQIGLELIIVRAKSGEHAKLREMLDELCDSREKANVTK